MRRYEALGIRDDGPWAIAVAALAGIAFAMTIGFGFVYDDIHIVVDRPDLQHLSQWRHILTAPWWNEKLFRPLTRLSLAFDWTVSGGSPGFFHFVNVVAHALVTVGVFVVARGWMNRSASLMAATLFAVHPVHVEAVASIVGRAEVFATGFAVLAVLAYRWDGRLLAAGDANSWRRAVASFGTLGAVVAGVASKESAFAIPGLLLLVDFLDARSRNERFAFRIKSHVLLWLASVVVTLGWLSLRTQLLGDIAGDRAGPGLEGQGLGNRVLIMAPVILEYVRLLVLPVHLSADYSPDFISARPAVTLAGVLGILTVVTCVWAAIVARKRLPVVAAGIAWIGGTILIISNIVVPSGVILAERSLYLPSVGFVLCVSSLIAVTWRRYQRPVVLAFVVVAGLGLARTLTRLPIWKNQDTFFPALVRDAPGSFRSQWVEAMLLYTAGERDRGEEKLREALNTYPLFPNTWRDYGNRLLEEGRWNQAAQAFEAMFRIDSSRTIAAAQASSNYLRAGNLDAAGPIVEHLRRRAPHDPYVQSVIGDFEMGMNRPLDAMTWFRRAAWQSPADVRLHYRAAEAAARAGYCPQFERSLERVTAIGSDEGRLAELYRLGDEAGCDTRESGI